jgi:hypothetical protein
MDECQPEADDDQTRDLSEESGKRYHPLEFCDIIAMDGRVWFCPSRNKGLGVMKAENHLI